MIDKLEVEERLAIMIEGAPEYRELDEKAVEECTESSSGEDGWKDPIPLDGGLLVPDFPIESLPGIGKLFVKAVAEVTQVDDALPAVAYFAVCSACRAGDIVNLISHKEPVNLYLAGVLSSGHRKTFTWNAMAESLYDYQHEKQDESVPIIADATNNFMIKSAQLKKLQDRAAKTEDHRERMTLTEEAKLIAEEIRENPVPTTPVYVVDDITTERLGILMTENNERMVIISAEGGIFKLMSGLYSAGSGNLDLYLKSHSQDPWSNHRVGRQSQTMMRPTLTMGLAIQPDVLEEIGQNKHFRGRGLIARFLFDDLVKSKFSVTR